MHYAKSLEILQPKYEMVQIAVVYNLASIAKMGYKDLDNNGNFVKIRGDEGEKDEPAQAPKAHTFGQIIDVLADFRSVLVISTHDLIVWMSILIFWVLK